MTARIQNKNNLNQTLRVKPPSVRTKPISRNANHKIWECAWGLVNIWELLNLLELLYNSDGLHFSAFPQDSGTAAIGAMASNLIAKASNLLATASNLLAMASNPNSFEMRSMNNILCNY